ncbi:hypothetical protein F4553_000853 [Allocatelliglobosispora scoriae]|uniref:Uncharacterized protein n=1 Tax=Allocatelliglobosispora scoriae TaxID=643052 RepID=A0A841BGR9_9ACTN|nr:hypothetical protein [Allocatelliglobosispora scoriae]MBB5867474.1 hypothetical protein [Allocatelliglobosispora scoriae]
MLTHPGWMGIGAIAGVLAVVATVIIATLQMTPQSPSGAAGGPSSAASGTVSPPASSNEPSGTDGVPAPSPTDREWTLQPAALFKSGSLHLYTPPSSMGTEKAWDLDLNRAEGVLAAATTDVEAAERALGAQNGAAFAPLAAGRVPTLAECAAIPVAQWLPAIDQDDLKPKAVFCVLTTSGRYGYLRIQKVNLIPKDYLLEERAGTIGDISFSFVLWKKPGD